MLSFIDLFPYNELLERMVVFAGSIPAAAIELGLAQGLSFLTKDLGTNFLLYDAVVLPEVLVVLLSCGFQSSLEGI